MKALYRFIFSKSYYFAIFVLKEREFPWAWAGMTTSVILVGNIVFGVQVIEYFMLPYETSIGNYYSYFSLAMAIAIVVYVKRGNKYLQIIKSYKKSPLNRRKVLCYISSVYIFLIFSGLFFVGYLIREQRVIT
jgi:hypothetical protein